MPNDDIEIPEYSKIIVVFWNTKVTTLFRMVFNLFKFDIIFVLGLLLRYKLRCSKYSFATFIVLSIQLCNFVKNCMCCKISLNPTKRYQMKSLEADVINREMIRKEMQNGFSNSSTELADATFLA